MRICPLCKSDRKSSGVNKEIKSSEEGWEVFEITYDCTTKLVCLKNKLNFKSVQWFWNCKGRTSKYE